MVRIARRFQLVLFFALVACGGETVTINGVEHSLPPPQKASARHRCTAPAPSGSDAQRACFEAAATACPLGTEPGQIEFSERPDGTFLIAGYGCV